jgi:hypothetical protein
MVLLQLPNGFKHKFFFANFCIVIEVGSSSEDDGGVVCSAGALHLKLLLVQRML